jgi:hypothetical protein
MDLGGWLRRLGLEQYEAAFRKNEIDERVLTSLTAEDLKDLGVGIVGHRRKLLDAIVALRVEVGASTYRPDVPSATRVTKDTPAHGDVRRCASIRGWTSVVSSMRQVTVAYQWRWWTLMRTMLQRSTRTNCCSPVQINTLPGEAISRRTIHSHSSIACAAYLSRTSTVSGPTSDVELPEQINFFVRGGCVVDCLDDLLLATCGELFSIGLRSAIARRILRRSTKRTPKFSKS